MIARLVSSFFFILCLAGGAQAQWAMAASNCVPADATIQFNRDQVNIGSVQHRPANVDLIVLNCPVAPFTPPGNDEWFLQMTYRDSTGTATTAHVRARLYRMPVGKTNTNVLAELDSDGFGDTGTVLHQTAAFSHSFDFGGGAYWVRLELDRSSTSQVVIIHSVAVVLAAS